MKQQFLCGKWLATVMLPLLASSVLAQPVCSDRNDFEKNGWQQKTVQTAMDHYLRAHKMRVNWLHEPRPPNAVGRSYYEWLWIDPYGADMKAELVQRYCGAANKSAE